MSPAERLEGEKATFPVLDRAGQGLQETNPCEWRDVFDAIGFAVLVVDRAGTILRCNRQALELLQLSCGETSFQGTIGYFHGAQPWAAMTRLLQAKHKGKNQTCLK